MTKMFLSSSFLSESDATVSFCCRQRLGFRVMVYQLLDAVELGRLLIDQRFVLRLRSRLFRRVARAAPHRGRAGICGKWRNWRSFESAPPSRCRRSCPVYAWTRSVERRARYIGRNKLL